MFSWRGLWAIVGASVVLQHACYAAPISSSSTVVATATPLVVPPSQMWDGNDGPWSSFFLRVGSPPQTIRVLVSTSSNQPLVVLPAGCDSGNSTCVNDRGGVFQSNASSTWTPNNSSAYVVALDPNIGLVPEVQYGNDTIALSYLGSGTPTMPSQLIGGITTTDLFTGVFGLNPAATNFSNTIPEVASYMVNLKAENQIPSLSYGYNAGNGYRFDTVLASLTLGGYDASLFNANNLTFQFNFQGSSDLTVNINSISQSSSAGNSVLSSSTIPAFIDTTTPYLWMPQDVCAMFEKAFGITYDGVSGLYLVNETLHSALLAQNANVTFTLGNGISSETVDIVLPYAAFDLIASWPLVDTPTRYFPLKRANSTSEITLGRTFFQEAYLIADYERATFSVSQMKWDPNAQAEITSILPAAILAHESGKKGKGASTTTIVAATICGAVFITVLIASVIIIWQRQKKLDILVKSPFTPAFSSTWNTPIPPAPATCNQCSSQCPSPEMAVTRNMSSHRPDPIIERSDESGRGSANDSRTGSGTDSRNQGSLYSAQTSSLGNVRRDSTPIPAGLALAPISPLSPALNRQRQAPNPNPFFASALRQTQQATPKSPGPAIPPRTSSLDRIDLTTPINSPDLDRELTSPESYYLFHVPAVNSGIYELPAREEVTAEMAGSPIETILQAALDRVIADHEQSLSNTPVVPNPISPEEQLRAFEREAVGVRLGNHSQGGRETVHPPVYGSTPTRGRKPSVRNTHNRTSQWVHSPDLPPSPQPQSQPPPTSARHAPSPEEWHTLTGNRGRQFMFDTSIHPSLRTAAIPPVPRLQVPTSTFHSPGRTQTPAGEMSRNTSSSYSRTHTTSNSRSSSRAPPTYALFPQIHPQPSSSSPSPTPNRGNKPHIATQLQLQTVFPTVTTVSSLRGRRLSQLRTGDGVQAQAPLPSQVQIQVPTHAALRRQASMRISPRTGVGRRNTVRQTSSNERLRSAHGGPDETPSSSTSGGGRFGGGSGQRSGRIEEEVEVEEVSPPALDPKEYSWLRLGS